MWWIASLESEFQWDSKTYKVALLIIYNSPLLNVFFATEED